MPETKLKELYKGKCVEDLEKHYNVSEICKGKTSSRLCSSACRLLDKAVSDSQERDQESSYIHYMKFLEVVQRMKKAPDYELCKEKITQQITNEMVKNALDSACSLKGDLIQRYNMDSQLRSLAEFEEQDIVRQKIEADRKKAKEFTLMETSSNGLSGLGEVSIKCVDLFALLKENRKILILDARSRSDFLRSHINVPEIISVPEECIKPGITATKLQNSLPSESVRLWTQRQYMDLIVLMDWSSKDFVPGSTLQLLRAILLKWDMDVVYVRKPRALEGGFEDWLLRYPSYTTDPHVSVPNHNTKLDDLLEDIDYPTLSESVSPIEKKFMFDRTAKPHLNRDSRGLPPQTFQPQTFPTRANPSVDRSSKAAAIEMYERKSIEMKDLLEKQEELAVASLSIEKERVLAEENWKEIGSTTADAELEEGKHSLRQLKEQELISKLMLLENNQIDTTAEMLRLKEELSRLRRDTEESETSRSRGARSPNANSQAHMFSNLNEENTEMEYIDDEESRRLQEETLEKERKIIAIEKEKEALDMRRKTMAEEREKQLEESRKKMRSKYRKQMEDGDSETVPLKYDGTSSLNRSFSSPNIAQRMDEDEFTMSRKIPEFDRTMKPSHKMDLNTVRHRDFQGVFDRVGRGLTGLKNLGNTCYMNSIMQCLSNTAVLTKYFCEGNYKHDVQGAQVCMNQGRAGGGTQGAVAEEVAAVVKALWSEQYRFISAKDLKNVVGRHQAMFRGIEQQDSHEFLTILMDWLHNDLQTPIRHNIHKDNLTPSEKAWMEYTKSKESLILQHFYGQIRSTVKCMECGKESVTHDSFSNLSLELPARANKCTLSDCLELYLKDERILGWNCPACKQKRDAVKKLDISRLPPILVIHFKRFYVDGKDYISNTYRKKLTNIDFPLQNLDMGQFSLQLYKYKESKNTIYNLYGVSNHYGSMEGGHYTAYCKSSVYSKWYKFDDHQVAEIPPGDVKSSAAYILFYSTSPDGINH